jgi:hypothetical protein
LLYVFQTRIFLGRYKFLTFHIPARFLSGLTIFNTMYHISVCMSTNSQTVQDLLERMIEIQWELIIQSTVATNVSLSSSSFTKATIVCSPSSNGKVNCMNIVAGFGSSARIGISATCSSPSEERTRTSKVRS